MLWQPSKNLKILNPEKLYNLVIHASNLLQKLIEYLLKTEIGGSRKNIKR